VEGGVLEEVGVGFLIGEEGFEDEFRGVIGFFPFLTGEELRLSPFDFAFDRTGEVDPEVLNEEGEVRLDDEVLTNSIDESESASSELENSAEDSVEDDNSIQTGGGFFRDVVDFWKGLGGDGERDGGLRGDEECAVAVSDCEEWEAEMGRGGGRGRSGEWEGEGSGLWSWLVGFERYAGGEGYGGYDGKGVDDVEACAL